MHSSKSSNWRKQNESITSRLKFVLHQDKFTDATISIQGKEFRCHRLILALGSPYFERTFYHTFNDDRLRTVSLSDVSPEAFQRVQIFLYTGNVTFGNENQAFTTFEAADKFEMDDLKTECEIYLAELDFRPENIWTLLTRSSQLKMTKLLAKCFSYIQRNTKVCLANRSFSAAPENVVLELVKSDQLAISESDLLNRLIYWGLSNMKVKEDQLDTFLLPYLRHIRFKVFTTRQFCSVTKAHPTIISSNDCLAILQYLEFPNSKSSLPHWCSVLPERTWP